MFKKGNDMGKSYNHLFEFIIDRKNIRQAILNAFKKSKVKKLRVVQEILNNMDLHIENIRNMLLNGKFTVQKHFVLEIPDKGTGKIRKIICPFYYKNIEGFACYEHVIHHLVILALQQNILKSIYDFSCGSIPNRGGTYGKKYIEKFTKEHAKDCKYCLQADIHHFYESINIDRLKEKLRKKIHDDKFLNVLFTILDSNTGLLHGKWVSVGLPIGYYSSQWLANWYLCEYDHAIKEKLKVKFYARYVDDQVMFSSNKRFLRKVLTSIKELLFSEGLKLKRNYQIFKFSYSSKDGKEKGRPLDFLGYKFYWNRITLRKRILARIYRKATKIYKKVTISHYEARQFLSYIGWRNRTKIYLWYKKYITPKVKISTLKKVVSIHDKKFKSLQVA